MEERVQKFVLLIAIGPVQQFIAQARKTRDLWFGSHLLSELSKCAASELMRQGADLIFPYVDPEAGPEQFQNLRVANKIVGIVETDDPRQVALLTRKATTLRWIELAEHAKNLIRKFVNQGMWDKQIRDFIEFYTVWTPFEGNYREALEKADTLLAARKTLRDFKQNEPKNVFGDKKSSLDPGRESVIHSDRLDELYHLGVKGTETLDAVSLVKRLALHIYPEARFPSVCDIAFKPYRMKILTCKEQRRLVDNYYTELRQLYGHRLRFEGTGMENYESALFYENRIEDFVDERIIPGGGAESKGERQKLMRGISERLLSLYDEKRLPQPKSYYAFLVCDGDRMGRHLRSLTTEREHRVFSSQLSQFAQAAERIVEAHGGQLVYSGGDDVMAYLPLTSCLNACDDLRSKFKNTMQQAFPESEDISLSIGLIVVHMLERLGEVRKLAQQAEQTAKKRRDALAVMVRKRSGGTLTDVSFPFIQNPVENITFWKTEYQKGNISAGLPYALRKLYLEYDKLSDQLSLSGDDEAFRTLLMQEAERIVKQKLPETNHKPISAKICKAFQGEDSPLEQLRTLAEQMIIAITLAKEVEFVETSDSNSTVGADH